MLDNILLNLKFILQNLRARDLLDMVLVWTVVYRVLILVRHTGTVLVAASVTLEYGFTDIDGKRPRPLTLADV